MTSKKDLENIIDELEEEIKVLNQLMNKKTIGVMTVDVPANANKDVESALLKSVQERMDNEMKRIGFDMEWIVMPSTVKTVQTITVRYKEE